MRRILVSIGLMLVTSASLFAQEWIEFASREDRFTCNFPSQPKITQTTYRSLHEADLPARTYGATQGQSRYSVTVVDYTQAQRILTEKAKSCPAGAEPCLGSPGDEGHWKADIRGAIDYATWQYLQRDAKLTLFVWNVVDLVEGRLLQLTNPDKSRTFAGIYMHSPFDHVELVFVHINPCKGPGFIGVRELQLTSFNEVHNIPDKQCQLGVPLQVLPCCIVDCSAY